MGRRETVTGRVPAGRRESVARRDEPSRTNVGQAQVADGSEGSLFLLAITIEVWQRWKIPGLWGIWALIVLLVPPPLDREKMLISELQLLSSWLASKLLDAFGVLHVMQGNKLMLSSKELFVDEACSGIVSMMSIVACALIIAVWYNRPILHLVLLLLSSLVWAAAT